MGGRDSSHHRRCYDLCSNTEEEYKNFVLAYSASAALGTVFAPYPVVRLRTLLLAATTTNPSDVRRKLLQCLIDYGVLQGELAAKQLTEFQLQRCKRQSLRVFVAGEKRPNY
jgi:hypothetical protein